MGNRERPVDNGRERTRSGRLVTLPTSFPWGSTFKLTTKRHKRNQPEGPPRGGMEDGPILTDQTVTNGMNNDNEKVLQKCKCGWQKVTSFKGLRIHQGKMKCGRTPDQHDRTASAGQTEETQSQVTNHSAAGPSNAERATSVEVGEEMEAAPPTAMFTLSLRESHSQRAYANIQKDAGKSSGRRQKIKRNGAGLMITWKECWSIPCEERLSVNSPR